MGRVSYGRVLELAQPLKPDAEWAAIVPPLEARGFISVRFVELSRNLTPDDIVVMRQRELRALRGEVNVPSPGTVAKRAGEPGQPQGASAKPGQESLKESSAKSGQPKPAALTLPMVVSDRLKLIYERVQKELIKPALDWDFSRILTDLNSIEETTEDSGEAELAGVWSDHIRVHYLTLLAELSEAEEKNRLARTKHAQGVKKEKEASSVLKPDAKDESPYLARGWVFAMPKSNKIEGTHKLMKGNRLLFYIKSDTIDLNKLLYKRVAVTGIVQDLPSVSGARLIQITGYKILSH